AQDGDDDAMNTSANRMTVSLCWRGPPGPRRRPALKADHSAVSQFGRRHGLDLLTRLALVGNFYILVGKDLRLARPGNTAHSRRFVQENQPVPYRFRRVRLAHRMQPCSVGGATWGELLEAPGIPSRAACPPFCPPPRCMPRPPHPRRRLLAR